MGVLSLDERCDDGNLVAGDGCDQRCIVEGGAPLSTSIHTARPDDYCEPSLEGRDRPCGVATGQCERGVQRCEWGTWSSCLGEISPQLERCDGLDNDCDGLSDEGLAQSLTCGVGQCAQSALSCQEGVEMSCSPLEPTAEICNGLDDDCDGLSDESLSDTLRCGIGECAVVTPSCAEGIPQRCEPLPINAERCDGLDNDCDGQTDEGLGYISCGIGACTQRIDACLEGATGLCTPLSPSIETCNRIDDDCDGRLDEALGEFSCGVGLCERTVAFCQEGQLVDSDQACIPGDPQSERCDHEDNDCDGLVDEGVGCLTASCDSGQCLIIEEVDNQTPFISPRSFISLPDTNLICDQNNGGGLPGGGGGIGTPIGGGGGGDDLSGPCINEARSAGYFAEPIVSFNERCQLNVTFGDPDDILPTLDVDWGDGQTSTVPTGLNGCQPFGTDYWTHAHLYEEAGEYQVQLTARDTAGATAHYSITTLATPPRFEQIEYEDSFGRRCDVYRRLNSGQCTSYQPLIVKVADECYPLDALALCDPNQEGSPCPLSHGTVADPTIALAVFSDLDTNNGSPPSWSIFSVDSPLSPLDQGPLSDTSCIEGKTLTGRLYRINTEGRYQVHAQYNQHRVSALFKLGNQRPSVNVDQAFIEVYPGENFRIIGNATDPDGEITRTRFVFSDGRAPVEGSLFEGALYRRGEHQLWFEAYDEHGSYGREYIQVLVTSPEGFTEESQLSREAVPDFADEESGQRFALNTPLDVDRIELSINHFERPDLGSPRRPRGRISWTLAEGCSLIDVSDDPDLPIAREGDDTDLRDRALGWTTLHSCEVEEVGDERRVLFVWSALRGFSRDRQRPLTPLHLAWRAFNQANESWFANELNPQGWVKSDDEWTVVPISHDPLPEEEIYVEVGEVVDVHPTQRLSFAWRSATDRSIQVSGTPTVSWTVTPGERLSPRSPQWTKSGRYELGYTLYYEDRDWLYHAPEIVVYVLGDQDGDGIQDYADADQDNDGICDLLLDPSQIDPASEVCQGGPDQLSFNPYHSIDEDGDGVGDTPFPCSVEEALRQPQECRWDQLPDDPNEWSDLDGDGIGDRADDDDDGDGLTDQDELDLYHSNPRDNDSDGDGLSDGQEVMAHGSRINQDLDGDGEPPLWDPDVDQDAVLDGDELSPFTDLDNDGLIGLLDADSDGDGVDDFLDLEPSAYRSLADAQLWRENVPIGYSQRTLQWRLGWLEGEAEVADFDWSDLWCGDLIFDHIISPRSSSGVIESDMSEGHIIETLEERFAEIDSPFSCTSALPSGARESSAYRWTSIVDCFHTKRYSFFYDLLWRNYDIDCHNDSPHQVTVDGDEALAHHLALLTLDPTHDNVIEMQWFIHQLPNGIELNGSRLFNLDITLFPKYEDDEVESLDFRGRSPLRLEAVVSRAEPESMLLAQEQRGVGVYDIRLLLPAEHLEREMWVVLSPSWLRIEGETTYKSRFDPSLHQPILSGMTQRVIGPRVSLYTRVDRIEASWEVIRDHLLEGEREWVQSPTVDLQTLAAHQGPLSVGRYNLYVLNLLIDPTATIPAALTLSEDLDGVVYIARRDVDIYQAVAQDLQCLEVESCPWYKVISQGEDSPPLRWYHNGVLVSAEATIDLTSRLTGLFADSPYDPVGVVQSTLDQLANVNKWWLKIGESIEFPGFGKESPLCFGGGLACPDPVEVRTVRAGGGPKPLYRFEVSLETYEELSAEALSLPDDEAGARIKRRGDLWVETVAGEWGLDESGSRIALPPTPYDPETGAGSRLLKYKSQVEAHRAARLGRLAATLDNAARATEMVSCLLSARAAYIAYRDGDYAMLVAHSTASLVGLGVALGEVKHAVALSKALEVDEAFDKVSKKLHKIGNAIGYVFVLADLYKASQISNTTLRNIKIRQAAIDAADITSAFWGPAAVVQLTWGLSSLFYGSLYDEVVTELVGSPARALSTLATYFLTDRIPGPIVEMVYRLALTELIAQQSASIPSLVIAD